MMSNNFVVPVGKKVKLKDYPTDFTDGFGKKSDAEGKLQQDIQNLTELQDRLYAQNTYALLIILQGLDASGKDSTIKHVMSGVNPSGCEVRSFKVPSEEELDHEYFWRYARAFPERGRIGIFNRSYYEEVLVVRVHPELLEKERIPSTTKTKRIWSERFREMNQLERYLVDNGVEVLKFFLHISKEEQKRRFMARLDAPEKNWKFSANDVKERAFWDDYMAAFEDLLSNTSTEYAPWHIIPADHKWFSRLAVADTIVRKLTSLNLHYPELNAEQKKALEEARKILDQEK